MDGSTQQQPSTERRSLREVASVFLKIGAVGYGAAAVNGVRFLLVGGNFANGRISCYGMTI